MTMMDAKEVIAGLRQKIEKYKATNEAIKNACLMMEVVDVAHKNDELARLPRRILGLLKVSE